MKKLFAVSLLAALALLQTGCECPCEKQRQRAAAQTLPPGAAGVAAQPLELLGARVKDSVDSPGLQMRKLEDGRLEVTGILHNKLNRRIQVQVNCSFKDAQGFPIEESPYQNAFLDEQGTTVVTFTSLKPGPTQFTVRVREAR